MEKGLAKTTKIVFLKNRIINIKNSKGILNMCYIFFVYSTVSSFMKNWYLSESSTKNTLKY